MWTPVWRSQRQKRRIIALPLLMIRAWADRKNTARASFGVLLQLQAPVYHTVRHNHECYPLDGKAIAELLRARIAREVALLQAEYKVTPGLAVALVGKDPASSVYVKTKAKQGQTVGIKSQQFLLPDNVDETVLLELIGRLNTDDSIDGILVQLPLPGHIDRWRVLEAIDPAKDVDGFHPYNAGRLSAGRPALAPCTPLAAVHLIRTVVSDLNGLDAAVIGRSNIVGKPLAVLLGDAGCTVISAQLQSRNLPDLCRKADIVVAAAGCAGLVRGDWLKPGAVVVDVGIHRATDTTGTVKLVGDVASPKRARAQAISPQCLAVSGP